MRYVNSFDLGILGSASVTCFEFSGHSFSSSF